MEQKNIFFSILTPVYNVEEYLDKCIMSVLEQTYSNYELILVDDGSIDSSGAICDQYAHDYPEKISVYHNGHMGLVYTRRYAFEKAFGRYYVVLDSDDYLEKNALEIIYNTIYKYDCDCVIYGANRVLDGQVYKTIENDREELILDKRNLYKKCFLSKRYNALWRKAVRASLVEKKDYSCFYHIYREEDLLQSIELLKNAKSTAFITQRLYNYSMNPNSIINNLTYDNFCVDFTVRNLVWNFLIEENVFNEQDMIEYRNYCIKQIVEMIQAIKQLDTTFDNKRILLNDICEADYFSQLLKLNGEILFDSIEEKNTFCFFYEKQYHKILNNF